jgi:hypothetical protein
VSSITIGTLLMDNLNYGPKNKRKRKTASLGTATLPVPGVEN